MGKPEWINNFPECNSPSVERLLDAGAVIWAKSNVPFMLSDWQSFNDIYGCTNNPWDLNRTPGGSSEVRLCRWLPECPRWKLVAISEPQSETRLTIAVFWS